MKKIITITLAAALSFTSCDSFLDINQDPNSPSGSNVNADMIFPAVEMNIANLYGNMLRIPSGYFAQHYGQNFGTTNYLDFSRFEYSAQRVTNVYTRFYTLCLINLESVREEAAASEEWGTYLAATVLRAFTFQVLVDAFGNVPYTESLDINNATPVYDDGLTIYQGILAELDDALSRVGSGDLVCTNFLYGNASSTNWIQFANALKLRILTRMSDVENVQSQLAAVISEGNFPAGDIAFQGIWANESGKANPFYQEEFATYFGSTQVNVIANLAIVRTMQQTDDNRLEAFFNTNGSNNYTGVVSGSNFPAGTEYNASYWCRPNATYDMPVNLITRSDIEFYLAEYYARYGSATEAEAHYKAAIDASFAAAGVTGAETIYDVAYPWNNGEYKRILGIQKWVALSGTNNFEAWCELRRLKYPAFGTVSGEELYNMQSDTYSPDLYVTGTLYTPIMVNTRLGNNKVLQRAQYATSSMDRNQNAPEEQLNEGVPVFWAE
ncbi:MAG: SusD/RagB family nutrient-binding outer membrane lipoprotein [Mediterranea sp.]|jgi:hypothetical protein|nr:SusD/RagB family nutrient-binding outer membrane lipoprotein [Mediterranea sp.]